MTTRCSTSCPGSARRASARCSRTSARPRRSSRPRARSCRRCPGCRRRSRASCTRTCTARAERDARAASLSASRHALVRASAAQWRRWPCIRTAALRCARAADRRPAKPAKPVVESRLQDLVVITGFSGAGKSTAMNVFEDAGYFCVDNLPPEMIRSLVELFMHKGSKVERAAVVSDVRGGVYFEALRAVVDDLDALGLDHHVLFLEAAEQTLVTRYKETRRRHPLAPEGSVAAGVARRARAARAAARARGPRDRHDRHVGRDAARQDRRRVPAAQGGRAARADVHELRLQARPAARGGPRVRRALPAQPPLRGRAARADRPRRARRRVHRRATGAWRSSTSACTRCSTSCCRSTSPRARRTS